MKNLKKIIAILIAVSFIATSLPIPYYAQRPIYADTANRSSLRAIATLRSGIAKALEEDIDVDKSPHYGQVHSIAEELYDDNVQRRRRHAWELSDLALKITDTPTQNKVADILRTILVLPDEDATVREYAALSLENLAYGITDIPTQNKFIDIIKAVLTGPQKDTYDGVRRCCARAIRILARNIFDMPTQNRVINIVRDVLTGPNRDKDYEVRRYTIKALNGLAPNVFDPAAQDNFISLLKELLVGENKETDEFREFAASAFCNLGPNIIDMPQALSILKGMLIGPDKDKDDKVRRYAAKALCTMYEGTDKEAVRSEILGILEHPSLSLTERIFPPDYVVRLISDKAKSANNVLLVDMNTGMVGGTGDHIIRTPILLAALLEANPNIDVTVCTNKPHLYSKLKVTVLSDLDNIGKILGHIQNTPYDIIYHAGSKDDFMDIIRNSRPEAIKVRTEAYAFDGESDGVYINDRRMGIYASGRNIYNPVNALVRSFGIDMPKDISSVFIDGDYPGFYKAWFWLKEHGIEPTPALRERPLIVLNGLGHKEKFKTKGFTDMANIARLAKVLLDRKDADILIFDNGNLDKFQFNQTLGRFIPDAEKRSRVRILPSTEEEGKSEWFKNFIYLSDAVITVEGGLMHLVQALGKPYVALFSRKGSGSAREWFPSHANPDTQRYIEFGERFDDLSEQHTEEIINTTCEILFNERGGFWPADWIDIRSSNITGVLTPESDTLNFVQAVDIPYKGKEYSGYMKCTKSEPGSYSDFRCIIPEAEILTKLSQAGFHGIPEIAGLFYIKDLRRHMILFKELPDGADLGEIDLGEKTTKEYIQIMIKAAKIIQGLHEHGIIHNDIKPHHIYICDNGQVKILDFEFASRGDKDFEERELYDAGTEYYMSSKRETGSIPAVLDDIYSFGVVLMDVTRHAADVPAEIYMGLEYIWGKAMAIEEHNRYQSMADLIADLEAVQKRIDEDLLPRGSSTAAPAEKKPSKALSAIDICA